MAIILNCLPKKKFCESDIQFAFEYDVFVQSKLGGNNPRPFFLYFFLFNASNESTILFRFSLPFFCN